jgi:transposase-like protein/5-methylcytosine-specific restriction endonuclease McrA
MREDIIKKKEEIIKMISENFPKSEIYRFLGCKSSTLDRYLKLWGIEYRGNFNRRGFPHPEQRVDIERYLSNEIFIISHRLKNKLIETGIKNHSCELCGLEKWMDQKVPIELHHIDGNRFNNNLSNLQILCPNCHAQTDNNSGKSNKKKEKILSNIVRIPNRRKRKYLKNKTCICGSLIDKRSLSCKKCVNRKRKSPRPSLDILLNEVQELGYCATGRKYGVTDNAIRKWIKSYQKVI